MSHDKDHIHILFASRFVEEKGIDILLGVIEHVAKSPIAHHISWTICGDGTYQPDIIELANRYKNVEYLGKISRSALKLQYEKADFLFMPSRFLETFGLTALESLMCGTPIIGIKKGGLIPFITDALMIDESDPVESSYQILQDIIDGKIIPETIDVSHYGLDAWKDRIKSLFPDTKKMLIVHDYKELIGGAEYYIRFLEYILPSCGIEVRVVSYEGMTTPWKRRWMFILSGLAYWRGTRIQKVLEEYSPDTVWMHSVLRYHGPWVLREIQKYVQKYPESKIYLSHHDVGLIAAFPQSITLESEIPRDALLLSFLPRELSYSRMFIASCKWVYIHCLKKLFPKKMEHILFAPFLIPYIHSHFPDQNIHLLPHTLMDV